MALTLPLLALGTNMLTAGLSMAAYGLAVGLVDAGSNMQGVAVEHEYARPIMPTFHGAWTLGGILGTTLGLLAIHGFGSALGWEMKLEPQSLATALITSTTPAPERRRSSRSR